ncbi:multimerin-2-like isoform X3 [Oncorhynchus keta]|uniref:multimerin-2-like isoform X3 n=1 Tax=Oncorhynchus keta TaxID=8018 RepID=UPI00227C77DB|nr:multimerin-2-like isoform X3 [Oncorhynchus keta]
MRMKSVVSLLVLLHCCLSGAQVHKDRDGVSVNEIQQVDYEDRESRGKDIQTDKQRAEAALTHSQQTCQPDIHTVLREMSTMMAEQRVELRHTKTELEAMEARLRASESRLTDSERQVEELSKMNEAQAVKLNSMETRSNITESHVEVLKRNSQDRKVAFSASLAAPGQGGNTGPFNTGITLVYRNIYSNIGNAYNPTTGIFTAPVRGLYLFRFYIYAEGDNSVPTISFLYKNGHHIATAQAHQSSGGINSSNGVSLLLEVGDVVNMYLWAGRKIYDSEYRHSTFSGHLLFTM